MEPSRETSRSRCQPLSPQKRRAKSPAAPAKPASKKALVLPASPVAVVVVIPVMVVFEPPMRAVPVASVETAALVAGPDPARAGVRRSGPVSPVPDVAAVDGIPVAVNPNELGPRADRNDIVPRRGRRANLNSDCDLGGRMMRAQQES